MNYITSTMEYKTLKSKYGSNNEMIEAAFDKDEISLFVKLTTEMMLLEESQSKKAYIKSQVMSDMVICAYYRLSNNTLKYKLDNYGNLEKLDIKGKYEGVVRVSKEMVRKDIPLPNSFIQLFKNKIAKSYLDDRLKRLSETYHVDIGTLEDEFSSLPFLSNIKSIIEENGSDNLSEDCFIAIMKIVQTYKYLTKNGEISIEIFPNMVKTLYREVYYTNAVNGERLATKKEKAKMLAGVFKKKTSLLSKENEKNVLICAWVMTNNDVYYNMIKDLPKINDTKDKIKTFIKDIINSMDYMVSHEFMEEDSKKMLETPVFNDYLDSAEDEVVENIKILDMLKLIKRELDPEYGSYYENLAWNIASQAIKNKRYDLSEKQMKIIENNYNNLMRKMREKDPDGDYKEVGRKASSENSSENENNSGNVERQGKSNVYCQELVDKAKEVKKFINKKKSKGLNSYYKMVLDIIDKINKNKFATEKQANQVYKIYEENIENPFLEMLNSVDAIESDEEETEPWSKDGDKDREMPPPLFGDVGSIFVD